MSARAFAPLILLAGSGAFAAAPEPAPIAYTAPDLTLSVPATLAAALPQDESADAEAAEPTSFWKGWKGSVDVGVNGSEGNSETLNGRGAVLVERITKSMETRAGMNYAYGSDHGDRTKNRFEAGIRNDWILDDSPWSIFAQLGYQNDEFQGWNWRVSPFGGVGYRFIKDDKAMLIGRIGLGGSYTSGGEDDGWTTEGLIGFDYERQLTERQKIFVSWTLYPDLEDMPRNRWVARAGWEILVDPEVNMSLKLGVEDRYESETSGDAEHNDLDYFALLSFAF